MIRRATWWTLAGICGVTCSALAMWGLPGGPQIAAQVSQIQATEDVPATEFRANSVAEIMALSARGTAGECTEAGCCQSGIRCSMYAPGYKPPSDHYDTFVVQNPAWKWPQPGGLGTPVPVTYSYSNLLDGTIGISNANLETAVEQALALWAAQAPLQFTKVPDVGPLPLPNDPAYNPSGTPMLRFGHHTIDGGSGVLAHAYYPFDPNGTSNGLAGDLHFDSGENWTLNPSSGIDFLEVCVHEIGHALGLGHEPAPPVGNNAIMNPFYGRRYNGLGTGFLLTDDENGIKAIYVATPPPPCPIEQATLGRLPFKITSLIGRPADRNELLDELRAFRDQTLMKTPAGRDLVKIYYRHSDEVGQMLKDDPAMSAAFVGLVLKALPTLAVDAEDTAMVDFSVDSYEQGLELMAKIRSTASPALAADIDRIENLLSDHATVTDSGVTLNLDPADLLPAAPIAKVKAAATQAEAF